MATEKRLIDADVLVDELKWLQEQVSSASAIEIQEYINRINRQTTVDAVEVIRCKDCASGKGATHKVCPLYKQGLMKDDDFCSAGERKDNEKTD